MRKSSERTLVIKTSVGDGKHLINYLIKELHVHGASITCHGTQRTFYVDVSQGREERALRKWLASSDIGCEFWTVIGNYVDVANSDQTALRIVVQRVTEEPAHVA